MQVQWSGADRAALARRLRQYHWAWDTTRHFVEHVFTRTHRVTVLIRQISRHVFEVYVRTIAGYYHEHGESHVMFDDDLPDMELFDNDEWNARERTKRCTADELALVRRLFDATRTITDRLEQHRSQIFCRYLGGSYPIAQMRYLRNAMTKLAALDRVLVTE